MDLDSSELFEAQAHIYRHILNYANSMALRCALELGIPDIIVNHEKPITLQELVSKLNLPIEKTLHLKRLMRLLIHSNFFNVTKFHDQDGENEKEGYVLTVSSKLLLKNTSKNIPNLPSLLPYANLILDLELMTPINFLGSWFKGNESTAFETAFGTSIWEFANENPRLNKLFNDAMESNCKMMKFAIKDNKEIFEGVDSLVDVGGGTGLVSKILLEAFPRMNCIVLDLPHVVADMKDTTNLKYVGGDMFSSIPYADAIMLKNVLHDWGDEEVLKILKRCKEAISFAHNDGKKRKVIIMDMVIGNNQDQECHEILETKLVSDVIMMVYATGKERTEDEWEKLFFQAGFKRSKITHIYGLISIIEIFP
nr:OMT1 [Chrysanthemum indicum]WIF29801.1 OMT3 [Chrysanthemum indicum]